LVARARRAGVLFSAQDVFEGKTPAALAAIAGGQLPGSDAAWPEDDVAVGPVPLTPVMRALAARGGVGALVGRLSQWAMLSVPGGLELPLLEAAAAAVVAAHPVLASRLVPDGGDGWALDVPAAAVESHMPGLVTRVDVCGTGEEKLRELSLSEARAASERLDPSAGVMVRLVWLDRGPDMPGRVVLIVHHLVVDGVSWRVLGTDLADAYTAVAVPPEPVPFGRWARALAAQDRTHELDAWIALLNRVPPLLPGLTLDPARDTSGTVQHVTGQLPAEMTNALLTAVPAVFHCGVNDVLLAGLAAAVAEWRAGRGLPHGPVLVDVEGHGRVPLAEGMDLSRTVGWLTSVHPARLDPGPGVAAGMRAGGTVAGQVLKKVKEQLRAVPGDGLGYGILREASDELTTLPAAQIGFNYLGRPPGGAVDSNDWRQLGLGGDTDPALPVAHPLEISGIVHETPDGPVLSLGLSWPEALLAEDDMRALLTAWTDMLACLAAHAASPGAGGHTPSDFSLLDLEQHQIDEFEELAAEIEKGTPA
jgi:mycobactin peptide synthetase MbtF